MPLFQIYRVQRDNTTMALPDNAKIPAISISFHKLTLPFIAADTAEAAYAEARRRIPYLGHSIAVGPL